MGIDFDALRKQAQDLVQQHGDKIELGAEKVGGFVKQKYGHDEQVDAVVDKIQDLVPGEHGHSAEGGNRA